MYKSYAGIGSRKTPHEIQVLETRIALVLDALSFELNSGGAVGSDSAFAKGSTTKNIYVPSKGYKGLDNTIVPNIKEGFKIVKKVIPRMRNVRPFTKKLFGRNAYQVLGKDLKTPVNFVICYTEFAALKGGTAIAIRIAMKYNIPVLNLGNAKTRKSIELLVDSYLDKHNNIKKDINIDDFIQRPTKVKPQVKPRTPTITLRDDKHPDLPWR